jgi:hypothetical protein
MTIGLIIQFDGVGQHWYEDAMRELGLALHDDAGPNWPDGIVSHVAGARPEGGWTVIDVWESRKAFDHFLETRLGPAFAKLGPLPEPSITQFEVYNTYRHGPPGSG